MLPGRRERAFASSSRRSKPKQMVPIRHTLLLSESKPRTKLRPPLPISSSCSSPPSFPPFICSSANQLPDTSDFLRARARVLERGASMSTNEGNASQGEWMQYYQRNIPSQPPGAGGGAATTFGRASSPAKSTMVTTATTAASPAAAGGGGAPHASEGRVGKASRRRTRAARKAPTTLVDTDPTNFRAMVQQYTGAPPGPFQAAGYQQRPTTIGFDLGQLHHPQPVGFPLGVEQQQQQHFLQYQHQQHHERPLFTLGGAGDSNIFLQAYRFGGGDPTRGSMEVSDGYLLESISPSSSSQVSSTDCRTSNGYPF